MKKLNLKFYLFDWDDNILMMDTNIIMEKKEDFGVWKEVRVSTSDYSEFRNDSNYRIPLKNGKPNYNKCFKYFGDIGQGNIFLKHTKDAIKKNAYAPSYSAFKRCLIDGNLFSIVTARGHKPDTIRESIRYIIDHVFSDEERNEMLDNIKNYQQIFHGRIGENPLEIYLENCKYIGVSSPYFLNIIKDYDVDPKDTEMAKTIAVERFVDSVIETVGKIRDKVDNVSIGFSDDDIKNIQAVEDLFKNRLKSKFENVKFVIYDTSESSYKKVVV